MIKLLWVEENLVKDLQLLDEVEEISQDKIKNLIKRFKEENEEMVLENIDSNVLSLRTKAQQMRELYENVVEEEGDKTYELWEKLDSKRDIYKSKLDELKNVIGDCRKDLELFKNGIDSIDFYGIDRLVECIDKIRKLDDRDKELLSKLFDSHK